MKVEYLIDFLPPDLRRRAVLRISRRRSLLLLALMFALVVGVAAHSWNTYRVADVDRTISMQVATNSTKVDDVVDQLAADQQAITRFMGVYDQLALPMDVSDVIATVTHLMPERMSLKLLKFTVRTEPTAKEAAEAARGAKAPPKSHSGSAAAQGAKPDAARSTPPVRTAYLTIHGFAASTSDVIEFERRLNRTAPLEGVTITASKQIEVPGSMLQEFTITCRISLNARYEVTPLEPLAAAHGAHP